MNFDRVSKNIIKKLKKSLKRDVSNNISEINYVQMNEILKNNSNIIILDVRSIQEYNEGHINGAINIPLSEIKTKAPNLINYSDTIITYCKMGSRSKKAVSVLNKLGYKNVYTLAGGLDGINNSI